MADLQRLPLSVLAKQVEGQPDGALAKAPLMRSLQNDHRHEKIAVIERSAINTQRFADSQTAYFGSSQFVSRHVTRLLNSTSPSEQLRASEWLSDLALEFRM